MLIAASYFAVADDDVVNVDFNANNDDIGND